MSGAPTAPKKMASKLLICARPVRRHHLAVRL
jgi:hypothetical protein